MTIDIVMDPSSSAPSSSMAAPAAPGAGAGAGAGTDTSSCCYDILAADAHGHLHHIPFPCSASHGSSKQQDALALQLSSLSIKSSTASSSSSAAAAFGPSRAVHKVACGILEDGTNIAALSRRDASIDILAISSSPTSTSARPNKLSAQLLFTIHEPRMRQGMERWVGLAIGRSRIYSCTSAGAFRLTSLHTSNSTISIASTAELDLPSPLQDCTFLYPSSSSSSSTSERQGQDPTHFAYGGEEIPLSLWHIDSAFPSSSNNQQAQTRAPTDRKQAPSSPASEQQSSEEALNSKQRKRKRQAEARAAAKELLDGEVFRAKNLPNDGLGLPQRAQITSIAYAYSQAQGEDRDKVEGEPAEEKVETSLIPKNLWLLTGIRDGLIRLFHPSSGVRKRISEFRVTPAGQEGNAIKALAMAGTSAAEVVFASDASQKVFAVDWRKGKVLGQLKDINGSVNAMQSLPPPLSLTKLSPPSSAPFQRLVTSSQDRLLRLHHTPTYADKLNSTTRASASASVREARLYAHAFAAQAPVTAIAWLGNVPACTVEKAEGKAEELDHSGAAQNGGEEDEDFEGMETVGVGADSSEDEDEEEEEEEEDDQGEEQDGTTAKKGNGKQAKRVRLAA